MNRSVSLIAFNNKICERGKAMVPAKIVFDYECTEEGWKLKKDKKKPEDVSKRGEKFLPMLLEVLKHRPTVSKRVGVVLQYRLFGLVDRGPCMLGTLLSIQDIPHNLQEPGEEKYSDFKPQLYAPALYDEDDFNLAENEKKLAEIMGIDELPKDVMVSIKRANWNFDLVLWLHQLDESIDTVIGNLRAQVQAIRPHASYEHVPGVWKVSGSEESSLEILESCVCLPWVPPRLRFLSEELWALFILANEANRRALLDISDIWQKKNVRNVLISGDSGTGKEIAARLVHVGKACGKFVKTSVGGQEWEDLEIPFLGKGQRGGPAIFKGFIEEARGGALLLDECDKARRSVRDAMLRIIEADEYYRPFSWERIVMDPENRPIFILAGSGSGEEATRFMNKYNEATDGDKKLILTASGLSVAPDSKQRIEMEEPMDFWHRMDSHIKLEHPCYDKEKKAIREDQLELYVRFFITRAREIASAGTGSLYAADRLLERSQKVLNGRVADILDYAISELIRVLKTKAANKPIPSRLIRNAATLLYDKLIKDAYGGNIELTDIPRIVKDAAALAK